MSILGAFKFSRRFENASTTGPCSNLLLTFIYWRGICPTLQVPRLVSHPKLFQELERVGLVNPTLELPYLYARSTIHFYHLLFVTTNTLKSHVRNKTCIELSGLKMWAEDKVSLWFLRTTFIIPLPYKNLLVRQWILLENLRERVGCQMQVANPDTNGYAMLDLLLSWVQVHTYPSELVR